MEKLKVGETLFLVAYHSHNRSGTFKITKVGRKYAELDGILGRINLDNLTHEDGGYSHYTVYKSEKDLHEKTERRRIFDLISNKVRFSPDPAIGLDVYTKVALLLNIDITK